MKLILASRSPRRKELLDRAGLSFCVIPPESEETHDCLFPLDAPIVNATLKAEEVSRRHPEALVLGADTVVWLEERLIGKPVDLADAERMLLSLSGKTHTVHTGVCLLNPLENIRCVFMDSSHVTFKPFDLETARRYFKLVHPLDKAGAYGIQENMDMIIAKVEGSVANVAGLPIERVMTALRACGHST